jgi:hypothetical protein
MLDISFRCNSFQLFRGFLYLLMSLNDPELNTYVENKIQYHMHYNIYFVSFILNPILYFYLFEEENHFPFLYNQYLVDKFNI